jgi:hypothetical protein
MEVIFAVHDVVQASVDVLAFAVVVDSIVDNHLHGINVVDMGDLAVSPFFLGIGPKIIFNISDINNLSTFSDERIELDRLPKDELSITVWRINLNRSIKLIKNEKFRVVLKIKGKDSITR